MENPHVWSQINDEFHFFIFYKKLNKDMVINICITHKHKDLNYGSSQFLLYNCLANF